MKKRIAIAISVAVLALCSGALWAQQDSSNKQAPVDNSTQPLQPDQPLYQDQTQKPSEDQTPEAKPQPVYNSGVLAPQLQTTEADGEGMGFRKPTLIPSFNFATSATGVPGPNGIDWTNQQSVAGNLQFHWNVGRSGSMFYNGTGRWDSITENAIQVQQFGYSQGFQFGRWSGSMTDEISYSPQASFGFGALQGLGGTTGFGSGSGGYGLLQSQLLPGLSPDQSIFTGNADRISNTTGGELRYSLTARTSVRAGGSYGMIRGIDSGIQDGNQYTGSTGVDYRLDPSNTFGVTYTYGAFTYPGAKQNTNTHSAEFSWTRRLTGRLNLQAAVGSQFTNVDSPTVSRSQLSWGAQAVVDYHRNRNSMSLTFLRGVTGGSGVVAGAETYSLQTMFQRQLSQSTSMTLHAGYARNSALQGINQVFNSHYAGIAVNRRVFRYGSLYFDYSLQRQTSTVALPITTGLDRLQHVFAFGFNFAFRPIQITQ